MKMSDGKIAIPLETVKDVANFVLAHPRASVVDVMAEFDLSDDEAFFALATARYVIQEIAKEREER